MLCRKQRLDGVLIGCCIGRGPLRKEGKCWAVRWQSDVEKKGGKLAAFAYPYMQLQHGS
jgi:hypothetical protein